MDPGWILGGFVAVQTLTTIQIAILRREVRTSLRPPPPPLTASPPRQRPIDLDDDDERTPSRRPRR